MAADGAIESNVSIEQIGQTQTHEVPLDEADMSAAQATGDLSVVEAPPASVTDVQEKIIEADL